MDGGAGEVRKLKYSPIRTEERIHHYRASRKTHAQKLSIDLLIFHVAFLKVKLNLSSNYEAVSS